MSLNIPMPCRVALLIAFPLAFFITNHAPSAAAAPAAMDEKVIDYVRKVAKKAAMVTPQVSYRKDLAFRKPAEDARRIIQLLEVDGKSMVVVKGGRKEGVVAGEIFVSYRLAPSPTGKDEDRLWVETGVMKAVHLEEHFSLARVVSNTSFMSRAMFPRHSGVMAGDWVREKSLQITRRPILTPTTSIGYHEIFEDPMAWPNSFELTEEGRSALRKAAAPYLKFRLPILFVEAYTDAAGPADSNQVESYQRALTVRQFLIEDMGFTPQRVVAIGYGETEQIDPSNVSGQKLANRRITFRVNSQRESSH